MKAKLNLGGGIKDLVGQHIEKGIFALCLLLTMLLVFKSVNLRGDFKLQPDELKQTSLEAETQIKQDRDPLEEKIAVPHWGEIASNIDEDIPASPYPIQVRWMNSLFPGATLRSQPEVFGLEELRASTGFGGVQMSTAGMGATMTTAYSEDEEYGEGMDAPGNLTGQRWVVLTGLLPYRKQFQEYGRVFRSAELKDPRRDIPQYIHYQVDRAEVTPGVDPQPEDWKPIHVMRELAKTRKWAGASPEIIFPKFLHPPVPNMVPMAFPLPPLAKRTFGEEIAHEPEIPLHYQVELPKMPEEPDWDAIDDDPTKARDPRFRGPMAAGGGYGGYGGGYGEDEEYSEGGYGGYGGYGGGYEEYEQDYGAGYGGYGGGYGAGYGGYGEGYGEDEEYSGYGMTMQRREIPQYQLFRFFDFTVEPGKFYRYRVRLRIANPNYEIPVQYLEDQKLAEATFLESATSNETSTVRVPLDSRILAGPVKPSVNVNNPPRATIVSVHFDQENGKEVAEEFDIYRGQILNFLGVEVKEEEPVAGMYGYGEDMEYEDMMGEEGYGYDDEEGFGPRRSTTRRRERKPPEEVETVDYVTEMLVLDFLGGETLLGRDRDLREAGRYLMMDPAGNLVMQNELEDQEDWWEYNPPEVEQKPIEEEYGEEGYGFGDFEDE